MGGGDFWRLDLATGLWQWAGWMFFANRHGGRCLEAVGRELIRM